MQCHILTKKIHIHSDLDKAAEAQAEYVINQDPVDRIRETVQLILRVYSTKEKSQELIRFILIRNEYFHGEPPRIIKIID
ncbi:MAG: hypothetical protein JNM51_01450 [Bacteroidia bacterium]|nr:hypothetical protein [Bacteroidia bacterium]